MYKVTFWMNIASHYQRDFFLELSRRKQIKLFICYFEHIDDDRKKLGWNEEILNDYECYVTKPSDIYNIRDYKENLHVILGNSYPFNRELIKIINNEDLKWCHWSEPYGINCWERAHFNPLFAKLLLQLMYWRKRPYGHLIANSALFAMGQGILAKRNFVKWGVPEEKIRMLYYCGNKKIITDTTIKEKLNLKGKKIFLYLGQLNYRKGIDILIDAFASLKRNDDWLLLLIGHDFSNGYYQKHVNDLKLFEKIIFIPSIPPSEIGNYLNLCDVFVLPTRYDGWGIVLNEAASVGKPLIATSRAGAAWHVIKEGKNGYMIEPNRECLRFAMQNYVDSPELIKIHGKNSEQIFDAEFSASKNADRFISYLQEFVK